MNETTETTVKGSDSLLANEHVKQLLIIIEDNGKDTSGLMALINHVSDMENFVKQAESRIADMKSQLDTMKEVQDHPIKNSLQKTIAALETKATEIKTAIAELKSNIIEGCKNAVSSFKEKGAEVLDKLTSFFKIKGNLQSIKDVAVKTAENCDKSVAKIEAFSTEYHKAGRALKNMARMAIGKPPIDAVKEAGKLSKVFAAPYKAQKAVQNAIGKQADKMMTSLDNLDKGVAARQNERAATTEKSEKPSLLATLEANEQRSKEQFGGAKTEPAKDAPKKSKGEEL